MQGRSLVRLIWRAGRGIPVTPDARYGAAAPGVVSKPLRWGADALKGERANAWATLQPPA
jgi:hypothetical protein